MERIGFIGMGNMGYALLKGMLKDADPEKFIFSCKTAEKKKKITDETKVTAATNTEVVEKAKYVVLAIKPQMFDDVLPEISSVVKEDSIFISLAPGKSIEKISKALGGNVRVVRAMPNTPALIGFGMTGIAYEEERYTKEEIQMIEKLFSSVGNFRKVDESLMSAVVCASGSSPAYVYMFIDALASDVEAKGLSREEALDFVARAVVGAGQMVIETGEDPDKLKSNVCSKGGTTIAGITQLEAKGFVSSIDAATEACYIRSEELA